MQIPSLTLASLLFLIFLEELDLSLNSLLFFSIILRSAIGYKFNE